MGWKSFWKKFGLIIAKVAAALGAALFILWQIMKNFGPPTESERNEKIKKDIDNQTDKNKDVTKDVEETTKPVKKSHKDVKDSFNNRKEKEKKFFK